MPSITLSLLLHFRMRIRCNLHKLIALLESVSSKSTAGTATQNEKSGQQAQQSSNQKMLKAKSQLHSDKSTMAFSRRFLNLIVDNRFPRSKSRSRISSTDQIPKLSRLMPPQP
uniref:Uncharacterized protein n=1 Tax=Oryza nivara TaxID=4536 RepID=A0A0E0FY98_ORYNI